MSQTAKSSRLNRIEGQVRGLARMVEEDRAALARVEDQLLREQHCVRHAMTTGNKAEQERKIEELMAVVSRTSMTLDRPLHKPRMSQSPQWKHFETRLIRSETIDAVGSCLSPSRSRAP